jgi:hypothetical protein
MVIRALSQPLSRTLLGRLRGFAPLGIHFFNPVPVS